MQIGKTKNRHTLLRQLLSERNNPETIRTIGKGLTVPLLGHTG